MFNGLYIKPPFFEIGPKAFLYGQKVLDLALFADQMSEKYDVRIIFTPQTVDIPLIVKNTKNLLVFAQHMDFIPVGRGIGSILPEAIKDAGAMGALLNHAEKPLTIAEIGRTIERADEVGLATLVCAGSMDEIIAVTHLAPNCILAEAPEMIGTGVRNDEDQKIIGVINRCVHEINPNVQILHSGGVSSEHDIRNMMMAGADATGCTSAIVRHENPNAMCEKMISTVRTCWDARNNTR